MRADLNSIPCYNAIAVKEVFGVCHRERKAGTGGRGDGGEEGAGVDGRRGGGGMEGGVKERVELEVVLKCSGTVGFGLGYSPVIAVGNSDHGSLSGFVNYIVNEMIIG